MPKGEHPNHVAGRDHYRANELGVGVTAHGYVKVKVGKVHPLADPNGWAYLHRLVVAAARADRLPSGTVVHHKDGDPKNNTIENLELVLRGDHTAEHLATRGRRLDGTFLPRERDPR